MIKHNSLEKITTGTNLYDLAFTLINESQHGFIVLDCDQNILICNQKMSEWAQLDRSETIGLTFLDVFPRSPHKLQQAITACIEKGHTRQTKFHGQQPILPLSNSSGELPHELHLSSIPDMHGGNYCVIEVVDMSRLHNLHQSFHTQTREFDDLIRSSIVNDAQLYALFDNPLFSVILVDHKGLIKKHNHCAEQLFSREPSCWTDIFLSDLLLDTDHQAVSNNPMQLLSSSEVKYYAQGPHPKPCETILSIVGESEKFETIPVRLSSTQIILNKNFGFVVLIEDYKQQASRAKQIEKARKDIEVALDLVSDAIIKTDSNCIIRTFNNKAEQLTACSANKAIGNSLHDVIDLHDTNTNNPFYISQQWIKAHDQDACIKNLNVILSRRDHQKVAVTLSLSTISQQVTSSEQERELIVVLRDNTDKHEYARKIEWHSTHDLLTGLFNRTEFEAQVEQLIRDVHNHNQHHAVLHLGLDQLKIINNTCGHDAGDALLREVATFIKSKISPEDTIARIGGDEFGILLRNKNISQAHKFAEKLNSALYKYRFQWEDQIFPASTSIGVAPINITTLDIRNTLNNAQSACLLAKDSGRNRVQLYATGHNSLIKQQQRLYWYNRIQIALDTENFTLHGQLITPSDSHKHLSARLEILVRMLDHDKLVTPDTFIPAAEHYQLMSKIDQWVVKNCLAFYTKVPDENRIPLNINLSGQSIGDQSFLHFLVEQIELYDINPSLLCFELTETAAICDLVAAKEFMNELAKMGCEFALDDFGSGLSSLSYLKNLPVNYLKIDGDFVKGIIGNSVDDEILQSINRIGHVMNIKTVAEYVETPEIQNRLQDIGLDYLQGYLIHKPISLEKFFDSQSKPLTS